jgi:GTP cyclohydrolase I
MPQNSSLAREDEEPSPDGHRESSDAPAKEFDLPRIERAVREILLAIGEDPDRDGLRDTPARVARAYAEQFAGLRQRPEDVLTTVFDVGHDEMVIVV